MDLSIVLEKKGRLSWYVGTYTMNTVTNTVKSLAHICVALGLQPKAAYECLLSRQLNLFISGDDKVVAGDPSTVHALSTSTENWKKSGYLRKNLHVDEPSVVVQDFASLPSCSHFPQRVTFTTSKGTFSKFVPTNHQDEILAKLIYSVGSFMAMTTQSAHALSLRNAVLCYAMHRDLRLLAKTLTNYLPYNLVPLGKQTRPRALAVPWMDEKDVNHCFTKIFSGCSMFPIPGFENIDQLHKERT